MTSTTTEATNKTCTSIMSEDKSIQRKCSDKLLIDPMSKYSPTDETSISCAKKDESEDSVAPPSATVSHVENPEDKLVKSKEEEKKKGKKSKQGAYKSVKIISCV